MSKYKLGFIIRSKTFYINRDISGALEIELIRESIRSEVWDEVEDEWK